MTDPIFSRTQPVYGPGEIDTNSCDVSTSSCAVSEAAQVESARSVPREPVYAAGSVGLGAKELVRRHDMSSTPPCSVEKANAYISCALAATAAGTTLATSATGIGLVLGAITTAGLASQCSRDVLATLACNEQSARLAELDTECVSRDGVLLQGAGGGLVCLVTK